MAEPLGGVIQGDVIVPAGEDGVEEKRVHIGLEVPAVHLDRELIPQDQSDGEGVVLVVIIPAFLGGQDNLLQGNKFLIGDTKGHVGDDLHPLGDMFLPPGAPDLAAVVAVVGPYHPVDGGEGLALAEQAGKGHQFPGGTDVVAVAAEPPVEVPDTVPDQGNRVEEGAAEGGESQKGQAESQEQDRGHSVYLQRQKPRRASARAPTTRNTPETSATPTRTVRR